MPSHSLRLALVCCGLTGSLAAGQEKFDIKIKDQPPPKEVSADIAKLLSPKSVQFEGGGAVIAEVWFRDTLPTTATAEQIKNGITYRELKQTEILAVVRMAKEWHDYRKQRVMAGVYLVRLGIQPMDGDHMGMGEFPEYGLLTDATKDTSAATMEPEAMVKLSQKTIGTGHPGVLLLCPMPAKGKETELVARPKNVWVVAARKELVKGATKVGAQFGIGLALEGLAE